MAKSNFTPARKPDYEMVAWVKGTKISQKIGAAWVNEDGSLHVAFDPFADINTVRDLGAAATTTLFDRRKEAKT